MYGNKWLILTLIVSLGANIALIGFFAGRASSIDLKPGALDPTLGSARILAELPEDRHATLRPLVREHMRSVRPSIRNIRRAQRELGEAILADRFERAAVESALARFREHLADSQIASHASFVTLVEKLTPAERRLLVEILRREPPQRRFPPPHRNRRGDSG